MSTAPSLGSIDAHVHLPTGDDGARPADLEAAMAQVGVARAVVVQLEPRMSVTLEALEWADASDHVCAVAGWVDVASPDIEEVLAQVGASPKFKSVALPVYRESGNHWLTTPDVLRGLKAVAARGLAVDVQVEPRQLPAVGGLARAIPDLRIVVAHIGSPFIGRSEREPWGVYMLNVAPHENVFAKLSRLPALDTTPWNVTHQRLFVESMVRRFGYERLMFGSDWPEHLAVASYREVWDAALEAAGPMTALQREQLTNRTALSFYRVA